VQTAQALDDLAEMFIRCMHKLHQQAKDALEVYRHEHQEQTDTLIAILGQIVRDWQTHKTPDQITEQTLLEANVGVIKRYNRFLLPKL
jgi:hypothetical protein